MAYCSADLSTTHKYMPPLNQTAMPSQSNYRDKSPSRIPRFGRETAAVMDRGLGRAKRPSRLELMQVEYQKQLLKQKEEKMLHMYEENQRRALEKVSRQSSGSSNRSTPSVRDFFFERRKMESQGFFSPPIDQHYKQLRAGMPYPASGEWSRKGSANSSVSSYSKGSSAGRDRACLLQPISTSPGLVGSPTKPKSKPISYVRYDQNGRSLIPSNGTNAGVRTRARPIESSSSSGDNSPPPNLASLKNNKKLSDFEKWKMEQDKAREDRLKRHQKINNDAGRFDRDDQEDQDSGEEVSDDQGEVEDEPSKEEEEEEEEVQEPEESDAEGQADLNLEIAKRQKEILAQIEQQERELEQLRQERLQKDELARITAEKEAEKDLKRKQRIEEERRLLAQERERKLKKEEEEVHYREMKEEEEERQKRVAEKKKALLHSKQRTRSNHFHPDEINKNSNHYTPDSPPPPDERTPSPGDQYPQSGANVDLYLQAAEEEGAHGGDGGLVPCKLCGRRFAADRVAKHQSACRNINKKRKVFDPVKMRTAGTEMSQYVHNVDKQQTPQKKKNNWKVKHENFIESIRYAKKVASGDTQNLGPAPKLDTSDLVPCPHCGRTFAAATAENHIPKCVLLKTKPVKRRR